MNWIFAERDFNSAIMKVVLIIHVSNSRDENWPDIEVKISGKSYNGSVVNSDVVKEAAGAV